MCLLLIAYQHHPAYSLVIAANRDEFYERPTAAARFWEDCPWILAGRDLEQMGTWLGITRNGRFAAVTNFRNPALNMEGAKSRGELVSRFLRENQQPRKYLETVRDERGLYNAFNLLVGDRNSLFYYGKTENRIRKLSPGVYGLSNSLLDTPWPKVVKGKNALEKYLQLSGSIDPEPLFSILADGKPAPDEELPSTGVDLEWERLLSSIFIAGKNYGTRSSSIITMDRKGHVVFLERSFHTHNPKEWEEVVFEFDVSTP
ncbi:MAG: NRDE family protein [Peptococcaceae bacterium]|jgi:uncharacterized protein with NRDE domain|nr:NRDE family protein [Peptococcaceae bacterium]MDH7524899.1 NRDE family protein [Peptococcaceae bacterium]